MAEGDGDAWKATTDDGRHVTGGGEQTAGGYGRAGANGTEVLSFLAYRQTIARLEIGLGSAVSVLLFVSVVLICGLFIKGFKVDLSQARGE